MTSVEEVCTSWAGDASGRLRTSSAPGSSAGGGRTIMKTPRHKHDCENSDLLTRTSWVDANVAYKQIKKGKAHGNRCALWLRATLQTNIFNLGCFIQKHCGKVLFLGLLLLSLCCVGLKTASLETDMEELWVEGGGRLSSELSYTTKVLGEGSGTTLELILQTPTHPHENVLTVDSLLHHYEALQQVTKVSVNMFDITWSFADICFTASFPQFDNPMFDRILESIVPCLIITPLDCFWEGSKLLGPKGPLVVPGYSTSVTWANLNPVELVESLKKWSYFPSEAVLNIFQRAGITSAYQEKPCLDPSDVYCPASAPNKHSRQLPNIGAEMTGGCTGFATKYMQWQEDLIIGAPRKNKTGHIMRAEALQSIIQLMGEKELFELYEDTNYVRTIDWTRSKAKKVLEAWQRKFTEVVRASQAARGNKADKIHSFSSTSLLDIISEFSQVSIIRVTIGYVLMLLYACLSLLRWRDAVQSQTAIALAGVLLVALSVAAALGLCSVIGIRFNASTTQILPFLALGIGVDDMFFIAHTFGDSANKNIPHMEQVGSCLRQAGVGVLLTSVSNAFAFFIAAIIPIPALKSFVIQAAILVIVNLCSILLVFPAFISLDLIRRQNNRVDVFCCFTGSIADQVVELNRTNSTSLPTHYDHVRPTSVHYETAGQSAHCVRVADPSTTYDHTSRCDRIHTRSLPSQHSHGVTQQYDSVQPTRHTEQQAICCGPAQGEKPPGEPTQYDSVRGGSPPPSYSTLVLRDAVSRTEVDGTRPVTQLLPLRAALRSNVVAPAPISPLTPPAPSASWRQCVSQRRSRKCSLKDCSLTALVKHVYAPLLQRTPVKVFVIIFFVLLLVLCIVGSIRVREGLSVTDVVPRESQEYAFLEAQQKYFSFYNFYAVTKEKFDYPNQQAVLHNYHRSFQHISEIIKKEDGSLPDYWLKLFRDWLQDMQKAFDDAVSTGCIGGKLGWFSNASDDAILAYKLLVQTGDMDEPVNRDRVHKVRLVSDSGIIRPEPFYNYLTAWTSNDALAYAASQADLHPYPRQWYHDPVDGQLKIPKSQPLVYAQLPFYLHDMAGTDQIITTIKEIRAICDEFSNIGLPNYPRGVPFTFWEQYLHLRLYLMLALICVLIATFVVLSVALLNPWAAIIVVAVLAMIVVELFGLMGWLGIKLSAVPAVILIVSVGIGVEFTVHVTLGFLTAIGSRAHRVSVSLQHTFAPVSHGAMSSFLGVVMLAGAQFDFIVKYFFVVLSLLILLGTLHGLVLLPVVLSMIGPPAEVRPLDGSDSLSPPTPEPSPVPTRRRRRQLFYPRVPSDISLTTITEEPSQCSHEVIVQPDVHVETVAVGGDDTHSRQCQQAAGPCHHVTTVRATTKVKVQISTVLPGAPEQSYKSHRRKDDDSDSESST